MNSFNLKCLIRGMYIKNDDKDFDLALLVLSEKIMQKDYNEFHNELMECRW